MDTSTRVNRWRSVFIYSLMPNDESYNVFYIINFKRKNINFFLKKFLFHSGLDPAGPAFDFIEVRGLNKTCARYVNNIITDRHLFGTVIRRGDSNIYSNYHAVRQPGCPFNITDIDCSHLRAVYLYHSSILGNKFTLVDCENGKNKNETRFDIFENINEGNFCLETSECFPFNRSN